MRQALTLDAWWPRGSGPWPIVIWVHGEQDGHGFKEMLEHTARQVAAQGYASLCINYRQGASGPSPNAIEDCLGATVWAKQKAAQMNGDPSRIAIVGEASGGQLAALAAYTADAGRFHPTEFHPGAPQPFVQAVISINGTYSNEPLGDASPTAWLDPHDPPTLLISSVAGELRQQAIDFQRVLASDNIDHELLSLPTAGNTITGTGNGLMVWDWESEASQNAVQRLIQFLDRTLK